MSESGLASTSKGSKPSKKQTVERLGIVNCGKCGAVVAEWEFYNHLRQEINYYPFKCGICVHYFYSEALLQLHHNRNHRGQQLRVLEDLNVEKEKEMDEIIAMTDNLPDSIHSYLTSTDDEAGNCSTGCAGPSSSPSPPPLSQSPLMGNTDYSFQSAIKVEYDETSPKHNGDEDGNSRSLGSSLVLEGLEHEIQQRHSYPSGLAGTWTSHESNLRMGDLPLVVSGQYLAHLNQSTTHFSRSTVAPGKRPRGRPRGRCRTEMVHNSYRPILPRGTQLIGPKPRARYPPLSLSPSVEQGLTTQLLPQVKTPENESNPTEDRIRLALQNARNIAARAAAEINLSGNNLTLHRNSPSAAQKSTASKARSLQDRIDKIKNAMTSGASTSTLDAVAETSESNVGMTASTSALGIADSDDARLKESAVADSCAGLLSEEGSLQSNTDIGTDIRILQRKRRYVDLNWANRLPRSKLRLSKNGLCKLCLRKISVQFHKRRAHVQVHHGIPHRLRCLHCPYSNTGERWEIQNHIRARHPHVPNAKEGFKDCLFEIEEEMDVVLERCFGEDRSLPTLQLPLPSPFLFNNQHEIPQLEYEDDDEKSDEQSFNILEQIVLPPQ